MEEVPLELALTLVQVALTHLLLVTHLLQVTVTVEALALLELTELLIPTPELKAGQAVQVPDTKPVVLSAVLLLER